MGPPSYMRSVIYRNVIMRRMAVFSVNIAANGKVQRNSTERVLFCAVLVGCKRLRPSAKRKRMWEMENETATSIFL